MSNILPGGSAPTSFTSYARIDAATWQTVKETSRQRLSTLKPLSDFFDRTRLSRPQSIAQFSSRLNHNLTYFQNNYILIVLIITAYLLFTNIFLLVTILFVLGGFKFISSLPANVPTSIFRGRWTVTPSGLWPVFAVVSVLMIWISGATGTIFYMIAVCAFVVCAHAGVMEVPVEAGFANTQEPV
ncbi:PRA1 family protein-domain-containing protein [Fimicolochytrium jonesii]|uniref:PRA1 family protein-domain-containing protein n=1 Tax=Fimicolochytrium jonesii TaxID=1396493 RepID=UPI0022FE435D|nr:PRA1 family protein-domain-containing protein [Fimicolochytrium jonesii]KAI8822650.1 PRA1 family protein-domain-containing protein [Fimicolochytrium jonesii]